MHPFLFIIVLLTALFTSSCKENLVTSGSVQFSVHVQVKDTSFVTLGITDTCTVPEAVVELHSVNYEITYTAQTDSLGLAFFQNVIPDIYNCSASKKYPVDTVKKYLGLQKDINLVGTLSTISMSSSRDSVSILLKPVFASDLLISEIYYNGAPPPPPYYFHDQFTEIYNNSSQTIFIDGYAIGDPSYSSRGDTMLHCVHLYQFPGDGDDYPIEPGETIIIAQDAIDHTEYNTSSLDLSTADFEYYNHLSNDVDAPDAVNMLQLHHKYGIDFLYSVMDAAIVLFKLRASDSVWAYDTFNEILIPVNRAVDGVEYREVISEYEYKHLPDEIDAGITGGMPMYQGKSIARKMLNKVNGQIILMDHNNSNLDFQILDTPTPGKVD